MPYLYLWVLLACVKHDLVTLCTYSVVILSPSQFKLCFVFRNNGIFLLEERVRHVLHEFNLTKITNTRKILQKRIFIPLAGNWPFLRLLMSRKFGLWLLGRNTVLNDIRV